MPDQDATPLEISKAPDDSTSYSNERYAHPFFLSVPKEERQPIDGFYSMTDWSQQNLGPIPPVRSGGAISLSSVIGSQGTKEIEATGEIRFHALGDTGVGDAHQAQAVAEGMATDYKAGAGGLNPAFLFHLGDIIYGNDKENNYVQRFYSPYKHYPGKIIAIPGNHDGETLSPADYPSLNAFQTNFCAQKATVPPQAAQSGIYRQTMTQPGAYWHLDTPFVRIIGLYSNRIENPGYLQGITNDKPDNSQLNWLQVTLTAIAKNKTKKGLIIAAHHPPYSSSGHSGSTQMNASIDSICNKAGIYPDLFLSAHAHNYQRYTRRVSGKQIPYVIVGTGGYPLQPVVPASGQPSASGSGVTYDAALSAFGYLFITASTKRIIGEFWQLGGHVSKPSDRIVIDLMTGTVS